MTDLVDRIDKRFVGVFPACITPYNEDFSIDEKALRRHLKDLADVKGVTGILINGHAAEIFSLSVDEQRRIIELAADEVGDRVNLIAGVFAGSSIEAGRIAAIAQKAGASSLMVFPSIAFDHGYRPDMVVGHYKAVADKSDLPLVVYQYAEYTRQDYSLELLLRLAREVPTIRAMKDDNSVRRHEQNIKALHTLPTPVAVWTTLATHLLGALVMGSAGILSGSGSVISDLHAQLFAAVRANDLVAAKKVSDRIYPVAEVFYPDPWVDQQNRMKEALLMLGRQPRALSRPPIRKLPDAEIQGIRKALVTAGLLPGVK